MKIVLWLIPAYGRAYNSLEEVKNDWEAGKDFRVLRGPYTSIRDLDSLRADYDRINILLTSISSDRFLTVYDAEPKKLIDKVI